MRARVPSVTSIIVVSVTMATLVACGVPGLPVPPENVGVNPTIRQQKKQEALELQQREAATRDTPAELSQDPALQGQDVNLPPLRPVGTR